MSAVAPSRSDSHRRTRAIEPLDIAKAVARAAWDSKAQDLVVVDVTGRTSYADYIVLCSSLHARHSAALAEHVIAALKAGHGLRPHHVEGKESGRWVLIDFGDVIVHVFDRTWREHYDLDGLWADAPRVPMAELGLQDAPDLGAVLPQPFSSPAS